MRYSSQFLAWIVVVLVDTAVFSEVSSAKLFGRKKSSKSAELTCSDSLRSMLDWRRKWAERVQLETTQRGGTPDSCLSQAQEAASHRPSIPSTCNKLTLGGLSMADRATLLEFVDTGSSQSDEQSAGEMMGNGMTRAVQDMGLKCQVWANELAKKNGNGTSTGSSSSNSNSGSTGATQGFRSGQGDFRASSAATSGTSSAGGAR